MHPAQKTLVTRLLVAFLLGAVGCYLICHAPEPSTDNSKAVVGEESSEKSNQLSEQASDSGGHAALQPVPDPGPGTKGFEPWAHAEPIEVAVDSKGKLNCDGSICEIPVVQKQKVALSIKRPEDGENKIPTLAFPTVLPQFARGQSIEVGVEYHNDVEPR
ncbi:MAG: hypothetical protein JXM70_28705 [Pirellulales bacterium]|nr:hypothetical protein [Pirellulales bacterium]